MAKEQSVAIWGGIEATVNRVGDRYFDQIQRSGHQERIEDLDLFSEMGFKTMRYPAVLWERVAPTGVDRADWSWSDKRLKRMDEIGIEPIAGFLHHGSGPLYTSLVDENFPTELAEYASAVIKRYPTLTKFTPVNEIMTTARFSGLYGHWYPHETSDKAFLTALFNQCEGTVRAMEEVRKVNPEAKLVTTEDIGKTYATESLQYQASFENNRRWWSYDLLTGQFDEDHLLWEFAAKSGFSKYTLEKYKDFFSQTDIKPDILGVNYYVTGERWLDDRLDLYPEHLHGGNDRDSYADTEAVRVDLGISGISMPLTETWERYGLPLAVTEAHLGCTPDEQIRWFQEILKDTERCSDEGIDVQAVTVWALLGLYDWNSLVTKDHGHYEVGAIDVSGRSPVITEYGQGVRMLIQNREAEIPGTDGPGWWRKNERVLYQTSK